MEEDLRKFLEELKYNQQINLEYDNENVVDIYYVIKRITDILNKGGK